MARQNLFFCNGVRIGSIADLYDNFNFEDLKNALTSGKLQQWLTANGFSAENEAVLKIDLSAEDADMQMMQALNFPEEKRNAYLAALQAKKDEDERKAKEEAERLNLKKAKQEEDAKKVQEETVQTTETPPQESSSAPRKTLFFTQGVTQYRKSLFQSPLETVYWVKLKKIIREETDMPESIIRKNASLSDVFELSAFDKQRLLKTVCRQFYIEDRTVDPEKINTVGDILDFIVGCTPYFV